MGDDNVLIRSDCTVTVDAKVEPGLAAIGELLDFKPRHAALVEEFLQVVKRLGGCSKLFQIDSDSRVTGRTTSHTTVRLEPSELLLNFLATVRTIERDLNVVEHKPSDPPILEGHASDPEKLFWDFIRRNPVAIRKILKI